MKKTGELTDALTSDMTGVWLVTTQGSQHVWDLDAMQYMRIPGPHSLAGQFDFDEQYHRMTCVGIWPEVGRVSVIWFDDPDEPFLEHYRVSSKIASIERLEDEK